MPIVDRLVKLCSGVSQRSPMKRNVSGDCGQESLGHKACNYSTEHFYDSCYLHVRLLSWHSPHGFTSALSFTARAEPSSATGAPRKGIFAGRLSSESFRKNFNFYDYRLWTLSLKRMER